MQPVEKTIIDRCARLVYRDYLQDPRPENMPILGDLYDLLREQAEKEAQYIATALEIYVNGSLNVFNHRSNVESRTASSAMTSRSWAKQLKGRSVCWSCRMQVWNRVTANRSAHKTTRSISTSSTCFLKEDRRPFHGGDLETLPKVGRHPIRASRRTSRICLLPARSRTSLKTPTSFICSTRPAETVRFWPSSWVFPRTSCPM